MALERTTSGVYETLRRTDIGPQQLKDITSALEKYVSTDSAEAPIKFLTKTHETENLQDILDIAERTLRSLTIKSKHSGVSVHVEDRSTVVRSIKDDSARATASSILELLREHEQTRLGLLNGQWQFIALLTCGSFLAGFGLPPLIERLLSVDLLSYAGVIFQAVWFVINILLIIRVSPPAPIILHPERGSFVVRNSQIITLAVSITAITVTVIGITLANT